jgi:succinate-semialdehyde dehydrogenase/glutarate-semialdehyde dehydrogenase
MGSTIASLRLSDPALLRQANYIDGQWVPSDSGATLPVRNPATGELVGDVPPMGAAETRRAIPGNQYLALGGIGS